MNGIEIKRGIRRSIEIEYTELSNCVVLKFDKKQIIISKEELFSAIKKSFHNGKAWR